MKKELLPAVMMAMALCGCISPGNFKGDQLMALSEERQCTWKRANRSVPPKSQGKRMKCVYEQPVSGALHGAH